ncbi:MAG: hypothetical protein EAZ97_10275 [Bacteroidetes bacterium]|nr:MAG: hypothetical protein EAZ97_10275 [Bacteroidota bacterium]
MKSFEKWETEEVERTFEIIQEDDSELMQNWLNFQTSFSEKKLERVKELSERHKKMANYWSEEDIKVFFIVPIIDLVEFYVPNRYRTFMEASLKVELMDKDQKMQTLKGRVEMVVATGKQRPQTPFFFLNEYKPHVKSQSDPQGQLLIAMLAAQSKNTKLNIPIYGLYTIGQNWFFVVLEQKKYVLSRQFDATKAEDLSQILNMLQFVKEHIERLTQIK